MKDASYLVEQRLYDAVTIAHFNKGKQSVSYRVYVPATEDMLIVEMRMEGEGTLDGSVRLSLPGVNETVNNPPLERVFPDIRENKVTPDGIFYLSRAFKDSIDIPTKAAMALSVTNSQDGKFQLKPGKTVRIICAFSSNFKSKDCVVSVIQKVKSCSLKQLKNIQKNHKL
ncbi:MAG: hypothetical protein PHG06_21080 [Parabacteroides sp.]|nr:hypothetical protein [Parabacteroides sp.]